MAGRDALKLFDPRDFLDSRGGVLLRERLPDDANRYRQAFFSHRPPTTGPRINNARESSTYRPCTGQIREAPPAPNPAGRATGIRGSRLLAHDQIRPDCDLGPTDFAPLHSPSRLPNSWGAARRSPGRCPDTGGACPASLVVGV